MQKSFGRSYKANQSKKIKQPDKLKILVVTETPPGTANGFGAMQQNLHRSLSQKIIFTDGDFKEFGEKKGYIFGQVPYHRGRKNLFKLLLGKIPEWRGIYSLKWLAQNVPEEFDIVISFVYSPCTLLWGDWISKKKNSKHVIHIADHCDFFLQRKCLAAISRADSLLVISKKMKMLYEKNTQRKDIEVFHNFPDNRCFPKKEMPVQYDNTFSHSSPLIVTFIGGLYDSLHTQSIEDILLVISQLRDQGVPIEMHLYGARHPDSFLENEIGEKGVFHHGLVMPLEAKYKIMKNSDAFVIPSSFDPVINKDYQYSFPSKLTELIASAKPVVYYGPANTAINDFLVDIEGATLITKKSIDLLAENFRSLLRNYAQRKTGAVQGSTKIKTKHNMDATLARFSNHLSKISS